jgi:hypothetical protein
MRKEKEEVEEEERKSECDCVTQNQDIFNTYNLLQIF